MQRTSFVFSLTFLFLSLTPVARAQDDVPPAKKAKAQKLFEEAEKQYYLGRFAKALQLYSKAYELAPLPGFLFNIGQCHRMMGNFSRAVFFYRGYLRATDAANRAVVEKLIEECRAKAQAKQKADNRRHSGATSSQAASGSPGASHDKASGRAPSRAALARSSKAAAAQVAEDKGAVPKPGKENNEKRAEWYKTWWFWTAVGVTVAIVAGATVGGVMASRDQGAATPSGSLGTLDRR